MDSTISERIAAAEQRWLEPVKTHVAMLFGGTFLPSHDQDHHLRVWSFCKCLLQELESFSSIADEGLVEGLLLASWFHDTGMIKDPGELHGAIGRDYFERFISESRQQKPILYDDVMDVIALHDAKERALYLGIKPGQAPAMMGILSIADDLDALGIIGIYRYTEIYLKRGVPAADLGSKILSNVRRRFRNIRESFAAFPGLAQSFEYQYQLIEGFFNRYNQLLVLTRDPGMVQWGELGIVNHIRAFAVEATLRPEDFIFQPGLVSSGAIVNSYFKKLHDELEPENC